VRVLISFSVGQEDDDTGKAQQRCENSWWAFKGPGQHPASPQGSLNMIQFLQDDGLGGLLIGIFSAMSWDRTPTTIMTWLYKHVLQATYSNCTSKLSVEFAQYTTCIEMFNVITMWFSVLMCKLLCARCATQSQNMKVKAQEWVESLNVIFGSVGVVRGSHHLIPTKQ